MKQLKELTNDLVEVMRKNNLPEKEIEYRAERLLKAAEALPAPCEAIYSKYYDTAHEIRCLQFLNKYGSVHMALDSKKEAGCDFTINGRIQVECICCSPGKSEENGWADYLRTESQWVMRDAKTAESFILSRITNALSKKREFYYDHIRKGTVCKDKPYVVFIALGSLYTKALFGDTGLSVLRILFGVDNEIINYDGSCDKLYFDGYSYSEKMKKWNGAQIDSALFYMKEYSCISGVIVTTSGIDTSYPESETWLFTNPYAINRLTEDDLNGMPSWRENGKGKYVFLANDDK